MRVVFVGAGDQSLQAIKTLSEHENELILIDEDEQKIEKLREKLDCGLMIGDGSDPEILKETNPKKVDFLFALSDSDQDNILTALVGKSLEIKTVVVSVRNPSYEKICLELGLENTIVPSRTIADFLIRFMEDQSSPDLKNYIKNEARLFKIVVGEKGARTVAELDLPSKAKAICYYRDGKFELTTEETKLKQDDENIILTHKKEISNLEDKYETK